MNQVILMGRLTRDPERRQTKTGKSVAGFTIAVDRVGKDAGSDFISCVAWERTADQIASFFKKGSRILVSGRLQVRQFDGKDGKKQTATDVVVYNWEFCEPRTSTEQVPPNMDMTPVDPFDDTPLPF